MQFGIMPVSVPSFAFVLIIQMEMLLVWQGDLDLHLSEEISHILIARIERQCRSDPQ